jgi:hypothetical protein
MIPDAKRLLAAGDTAGAIRLLEEHVRTHDRDAEAWLELALLHFSRGDRERLLAIHAEWGHCLDAPPPGVGARLLALWREVASAAARFASAAALGAVLLAPACSAGPTAAPPADARPAPPPDARPPDARPPDAAPAPDATPPDAAPTVSKPRPPPEYRPKNKYVAVRHDDDF